VNNVLPGFTDTDRLKDLFTSTAKRNGTSYEDIRQKMIEQVPLKRLGRAAEVASAVAFLASPAAGYISGINMVVDGGRTKSL